MTVINFILQAASPLIQIEHNNKFYLYYYTSLENVFTLIMLIGPYNSHTIHCFDDNNVNIWYFMCPGHYSVCHAFSPKLT